LPTSRASPPAPVAGRHGDLTRRYRRQILPPLPDATGKSTQQAGRERYGHQPPARWPARGLAGGSLSGQQRLTITELQPEIFPADGRPNVIINPTGMAVFDDGHTVGEALDVYRQVLADPNSAASLSNTPNPDTPGGIAFVQAWERAVRFKNSPEGQTPNLPPWRRNAKRALAFHSTCSSRNAAPTSITRQRLTTQDGTLLVLTHQGYPKRI